MLEFKLQAHISHQGTRRGRVRPPDLSPQPEENRMTTASEQATSMTLTPPPPPPPPPPPVGPGLAGGPAEPSRGAGQP